MPWTATIERIDRDTSAARTVRIKIGYRDGKILVMDDYVADSFSASLEGLKARIRQKIAALDATDTLLASVQPNQTLDLTIPPPTKAEQDRIDFFKAYQRLQALQQANTNGGLPPGNSEIAQLQTFVKTNYKPEYFGG